MEGVLNVSIVLYNSDFDEVVCAFNELRKSECINNIYLVDNSPAPDNRYNDLNLKYIFSGKNLGYGAAHNIAIRKSFEENVLFHLVMNYDVTFEYTILKELIAKMNSETKLGLIMPKILNEDGSCQILPKIMPTPTDLLIKVIKPLSFLFTARKERYTLKNYMDYEIDVPNSSGCFSLLKVAALKEVGIYDESFFMYFEDNDLTRRIHEHYRTIYYPSVSIIHSHERGATKNPRLFVVFLKSACNYFNKYGWFFDHGRKIANKTVLNFVKKIEII